MTPEQVERVAEILDDEADHLYVSFVHPTLGWDRSNYGREAKRDHDEYRALAKAARGMLARYRAARKGAG